MNNGDWYKGRFEGTPKQQAEKELLARRIARYRRLGYTWEAAERRARLT